MVYQLKKTQQLHCTIDEAWSFFSSPKNLSRITPKEMNFIVLSELTNENIYEGMIIDYKVSPLLNVPIKWQTKIAKVDFKKSFTDIQSKGPYKMWKHHHEFMINRNGILMVDTVDYELPWGIIGMIAHRLIVKKKIEAIFNYRYQVLEELFNKSKK